MAKWKRCIWKLCLEKTLIKCVHQEYLKLASKIRLRVKTNKYQRTGGNSQYLENQKQGSRISQNKVQTLEQSSAVALMDSVSHRGQTAFQDTVVCGTWCPKAICSGLRHSYLQYLFPPPTLPSSLQFVLLLTPHTRMFSFTGCVQIYRHLCLSSQGNFLIAYHIHLFRHSLCDQVRLPHSPFSFAPNHCY